MLPMLSRFNFYLCAQPTDMRKSFDGLCGLVSSALARDPMSGDVYVFFNRRRDRLKLLVWDRSGFWIFYKRLERGTFQFPAHFVNQAAIDVPYEDLMMIIEGIDLASVKRRVRYHHLAPSHSVQ
jgi:transposase